MINMKMSAEEAKEDCCVTQDASDQPRYPYGLEIRLDESSLAKLGITAPPAVGTELTISAKVVVTSASQYQTQGNDPESSSCWQITDMELGEAPAAKADAASVLYGGQ